MIYIYKIYMIYMYMRKKYNIWLNLFNVVKIFLNNVCGINVLNNIVFFEVKFFDFSKLRLMWYILVLIYWNFILMDY